MAKSITFAHKDGRTLGAYEGSELAVHLRGEGWSEAGAAGAVVAGTGEAQFTSDSAREKAEGLALEPGEGTGRDGAYTVADVEALG